MDKESRSASGGLSGNGIIAIVLLAAGVIFVREAPLEASRTPVSAQRLEQQTSTQDVDARLWQDPFSAVAQARAEARRNAPGDKENKAERRDALTRQISGSRTPVQVLAVLLPSGPYSENVESRRRGRYAVLSALDANRLNPQDTEHIGYFFPDEAFVTPALGKPPQPVPYEWFVPGDDRDGRAPAFNSRVLVMWIQSEALGDRPLWRLAQLARPFAHPTLRWRVLGPNTSDGLRDMVDEVSSEHYKAEPQHAAMRIYSLNATVPDRVLLDRPEGTRGPSLSAFFKDKDIDLVRTIGDDATLADTLTGELALRGLVASTLPTDGTTRTPIEYRDLCRLDRAGPSPRPSRVAVVSEWDTLYGRTLRREFRASDDSAGFCVERFSYVRGLDGVVPSGEDPAAKASGGSAKSPAPNGADATRRKDGTYIERAEGQNQFDYLRRLSAQIRKRDEELRQLGGNAQGFRAIGVLGSDLHDKLLVLQALRPEFPDVVFFTTDLDARYVHPQVQAWTRNLVVASNFGLRLRDGLQGGAPPFRDSYQTAAFFATRIAMDDARRDLQSGDAHAERRLPIGQAEIDKWLAVPRTFEIGRTEAFDFKGRQFDPRAAAADGCRPNRWRDTCADIHPWGSTRFPTAHPLVLALLFAALMALLWLPVWALLRIRTDEDDADAAMSGNSTIGLWAWGVATALMLVALPLVLAYNWPALADHLTREGKPMVLGEGISIWPTEALRLFTLLLCLYLIARGWRVLSRNLARINKEFASGPALSALVDAHLVADHRPSRRWQRFAQMFSMDSVPQINARPGDMQKEAVSFWGRHVVQNRLSARLARTCLAVALAALASGFLMAAIDTTRFVPIRGPLSQQVHDGLRWPALLAMYFLVFFVVDATVLCVRLVDGLRKLRGGTTRGYNWPDTTLWAFGRKLRVPWPYVEDWIDLQFIARRTACVTALVYYPFIVISLWLLSRSPTFDQWSWGISNVFPAALGAAIALTCAVLLRRAAEASRSQALAHIQDALMRMNAAPPAGGGTSPVKQLELLKARIENLQEGAFAPFWQQPLLKAVLLPFATLGGTSILDAMKLANL